MLAFKLSGLTSGISTALLVKTVLVSNVGMAAEALTCQMIALVFLAYGVYRHRKDPNYVSSSIL